MPLVRINRFQAHLWYVLQESIVDARLLTRYRSILSDEEIAIGGKRASGCLKREYLITRAMNRCILSRYVDTSPQDWVFKRNKYGKPEIASPQIGLPLRFNLSNTPGLIACLVTLGVNAGVDVEDMTQEGEVLSLAKDFFSTIELQTLQSLPQNLQREHFYRYWTLKEAYVKAKGMGLSMPLDKFSYRIGQNSISILFDECIQDISKNWQFGMVFPDGRHIISYAMQRGADKPDLEVSTFKTVPLGEEFGLP